MNIEVAITLVKQAIDQDKKKNYEEAARCYREGIIIFKTVAQFRGISKGVQQAILLKCNQYEERLKKLDKFLLTNADFSQLFKDVVDHHKRPDSQTSSDSDGSICSEAWKGLKNCLLYRQGIEAIEKGKKRDRKGEHSDALNFYEDGMSLLLEAAATNQDDPNSDENNEHLRFKCLLIHERIEMIRNHLDVGLPLKPINNSLAPIEYSLKENFGSPEPYTGRNEEEEAEEQILCSSELGSVHSLNHLNSVKSNNNFQNNNQHHNQQNQEEQKLLQKSVSMASVTSHENHNNPLNKSSFSLNHCLPAENSANTSLRNDTPHSIPLADLDGEMQISNLSLANSKSSLSLANSKSNLSLASKSNLSLTSSKSLQSIQSYNGSIKASPNDSSFYPDADCNITELTVTNSGLDLDLYFNGKTSPAETTESDSGISDQSPKADQERSRHESSAYSSSNEDEAMLQVHRVEDGTLVIGSSPARSSPPAVKISPSASMKRQAKLKALADELTVLSQEDVVDTALIKPASVKNGTSTKVADTKTEIPTRSLAGQPGYTDQDDDENYNKGCYYFIACLDSLWIL